MSNDYLKIASEPVSSMLFHGDDLAYLLASVQRSLERNDLHEVDRERYQSIKARLLGEIGEGLDEEVLSRLHGLN